MGTIGIYDADFMTYGHVMPNLECAKLYAYHTRRRELCTLTSKLMPDKYTNFFVRKDYDDGDYPKEYFSTNCSYGGRAFTPNGYTPLELAAEHTIPDMHIYDRYAALYGDKVEEKEEIKRILNCCHLRLSLDGVNVDNMDFLKKACVYDKYNGLIFHDYDLNAIKDAPAAIKELCMTRHYKDSERIRPYVFGSKFPIQVSDEARLKEWTETNPMSHIFYLQYNGQMTPSCANTLVSSNKNIGLRASYNFTEGYENEQEWLIRGSREFFKQILFFRRYNLKISLIYEDDFFKTPELKTLIELLNYWASCTWSKKTYEGRASLYYTCRNLNDETTTFGFMSNRKNINKDDVRKMFQYIREVNYPLFIMFYEWEPVIYQGGQLINEWTGDS